MHETLRRNILSNLTQKYNLLMLDSKYKFVGIYFGFSSESQIACG